MIPFHSCQYPGQGGHYESWFLRANHPTAARAFWIRYTLFVPTDGRAPLGELWAIWFDATRQQVTAVKEEYPLDACHFDRDRFDISLPGATLTHEALRGQASYAGHQVRWDLRYAGGGDSLLLLPERLYTTRLPKAKALVSRPNVRFSGELEVDGERYSLQDWPGSENHNWGRQHTDQYAWGQVAGFDNREDAFLECITARVRLGPFHSPWMTLACLRVGQETFHFNRIGTALRAHAEYRCFDWALQTRQGDTTLAVRIHAPRRHFTALNYYNPPGRSKTCLNSKLATCTLTLTRPGQPELTLTSAHRAAFEILTDGDDHEVPWGVPPPASTPS